MYSSHNSPSTDRLRERCETWKQRGKYLLLVGLLADTVVVLLIVLASHNAAANLLSTVLGVLAAPCIVLGLFASAIADVIATS